MPLSLYRRHTTACSGKLNLKSDPQNFTKCSCPVYCYRFENGVETRRSMKTRDWGRAEKLVAVPDHVIAPALKTFADARDLFLADCVSRHLETRTIDNYRRDSQAPRRLLRQGPTARPALARFAR